MVGLLLKNRLLPRENNILQLSKCSDNSLFYTQHSPKCFISCGRTAKASASAVNAPDSHRSVPLELTSILTGRVLTTLQFSYFGRIPHASVMNSVHSESLH